MQRKATKTLFNYWNELRGSRSAPERKNVDPTKIRHALSSTFILEADEHQDFAFRLAGSHLCSTYCRELKSRKFKSLWNTRDKDALSTLIKAVTEDHAVALITFEGTTQSSNKLNFETILLPLRHNGSSTNRILGAMTAEDEPYWFGAQPILDQRITGLRLIWPDDLATKSTFLDVSTDVVADLGISAEAKLAPISSTIHGFQARKYSHLSVIDGGKNHGGKN